MRYKFITCFALALAASMVIENVYADDASESAACSAAGPRQAAAGYKVKIEKADVNSQIFKEAIATCMKVATNVNQSDKDRASAYDTIASAYENMNDTKAAFENYDKSINIKRNYSAYFSRGSLYMAVGRIDDAIRDLKDAVNNREDDYFVYGALNLIGVAYYKKQDYDMAIIYFTKAIEFEQKAMFHNNAVIAKIYHNRGVAWHNKGDESKAQQDYAKEVDIRLGGK